MHTAAAAVMAIVTVVGSSGQGSPIPVALHAAPVDQPRWSVPTIGNLVDGTVLTIRVDGGLEGARGHVEQCERGIDGFRACSNRFPVLFDEDGRATFQYQLADPGGCGVTGACVVFVGDDEGERAASAFTVFGATAPPAPQVTLTPSGPYDEEDDVRVDVTRLPAGAPIETAFCGPTCGPPTRAVAGSDGTATATVVIGPPCDACGIAVVGAGRSTLVGVSFVAPPGAGYDVPRLIAGLTAAAALLLLAWLITARVDWRPPSEAQTPELDLLERD